LSTNKTVISGLAGFFKEKVDDLPFPYHCVNVVP